MYGKQVTLIYSWGNILDMFYCPQSRKENYNCFRPKRGLVDRALNKYPYIELDKVLQMEILSPMCNLAISLVL